MPRSDNKASHRRSTKVCSRCRKRKTKCDFKFPACTPCEAANVACMGFDPVSREVVPRSLVRSLEARVAELESELQANSALSEHLPSSMARKIAQATLSSGVPIRRSYLRSKIAPSLLFRPSYPPLSVMRDSELRPRSGATASPKANNPIQSEEQPETSATGTLINLSSVPFSAVKRMVQNYLDVHRPQYPCVSATLVETIVDRIRGEVEATNTFFSSGDPAASGLGHFDYFVLFITLAISAMTLTWKADHQARAASEAFYNSATTHLRMLEDNDAIQGLQISLLLAHYAHLCPERADNWTCITHAVRSVLDLGLHKGSPDALDPAERRQRCQLFWVTYGMERSLCGNLRLPLSFPEESITVPLDFAIDDGTTLFASDDLERESSANHIYLYRALETETHRVLHLEENLQIFGQVDISEWIADMSNRLATWYAKAQSYTQYNMLEFKHVQYNHLRARLHRPTPRLRVRSTEDRQIVLDAAAALIDDYLSQERRCRLFYPWHGTHILFETVAISLEACWSLKDVAEPLRSTVDYMLHSALPDCLDLLTKIGRRWDAAHVCVDHLRPIVAEVTAACGIRVSDQNGHSASSVDHTLFDDLAIAQRLDLLLFPDGPLTWDQQTSAEQMFAMSFPDGNSMFTDPNALFFDEMELFSWQPNWGLALDDVSTNPEMQLE